MPTGVRRINHSKSWTFMTLLSLVFFLYLFELVDQLTPFIKFDNLGILPRHLWGLVGIPLSPFLHADFAHLISNTFPFLVLGYIVLKAEKIHFVTASAFIVLLGGLGTWLIGNDNAVHIGASGLIYGYFGYVLVRGFREGRLKWIITGLFVLLFFGGMIFGVFPTRMGVSWEGHLCGMLAGAWYGNKRVKMGRRRAPVVIDI